MLNPIKYGALIKIENVPIPWIPKFEIYYPDLPQFPIVYVHFVKDKKRVYGFPISVSFSIRSDKNFDAEILFLCNEDIDADPRLKKAVRSELEERFGTKEKIGINDIISCCNGIKKYEDFFKELWKYISRTSGDYIPYGKFYEEIYSIVRFVSAWNPKTGRQSEMRMLYNFLSTFGEKIEVEAPKFAGRVEGGGKWDHLGFFLLPTYEDVKRKEFKEFEKFRKLFSAMGKIWKIYFTEEIILDGAKIRSMDKAWPRDKDSFIEEVSYPLFKRGILNETDRFNIERLVDAFNRHPWRAAFFIWCIANIRENDYKNWDKNFFVRFYLNGEGRGFSEKVLACFLQQGFKNSEAIPVDTWVYAFSHYALGIPTTEEFLTTFSKLGKLERAIWHSSQAKKTNIETFFDLLWCLRYGDTGNNELREANPISCYECKLRKVCPGYLEIKNKNVLVKDRKDVKTRRISNGEIIESRTVINEACKNGCSFVCITEEKVPKKVFAERRDHWKLTDEFSGYILKNQKVSKINVTVTVDGLIKDLPPFEKLAVEEAEVPSFLD